MSARESYIEKVRKLLAKAEGASTEAEAEAFFAKATELMTKWEIADAEIRDAGEQYEVLVDRIKLGSYSPVADSMAMQYVAEVFDIKVGYKPYRSGSPALIVLVGRKDDLERFHMLWPSLEMQMVRHMRNAEHPLYSRSQQRKFRQSFKIGFAERVSDRMKAARAVVVDSMALVLVKDDVEEAANSVFEGRARSSKLELSYHGLEAGAEAGGRADIGQKKVTK